MLKNEIQSGAFQLILKILDEVTYEPKKKTKEDVHTKTISSVASRQYVL